MVPVDETFLRDLPSTEHHRPEVLLWYARHCLGADFDRIVERHLSSCEVCRTRLETIRAGLDL